MKVVTDDRHYKNIADALRSAGAYGDNDKIYPSQMSEAVKAGIMNKYDEGYSDGHLDGVSEGIEQGKQSEQRAFWEELTDNGAKGVYYYTFSENRWTRNNFKPTCNIVPTEADHTFYRHNYGNTAYDLAQQLEDNGVVLDFSNCILGNYAFESAGVSRLPELNMAKGTFTCFVRNCKSLVTIDKIICSDAGDQNFTQTFNNCAVLKNITFEGVIGRSISFSASPLSVASLKSIINCLKDYTGGNEYTYTVTFKSSAFNALEAEGSTAEYNGTACTWAELVGFKKWNLTKA